MKRRNHVPEDSPRVLVLGLAGWALAVVASAQAGAFAKIPGTAYAALIGLAIAFAIATYFLDSRLRAVVEAIDLRSLTLFQAWRIVPGAAFIVLGLAGTLPETFARNAGWGDLLVGGAAVAFLFRRAGPGTYLAFHLAGLADLVLAIGTAVMLLDSPLMGAMARFPLALIPMFGVAVSAAAHVAALDRLVRGFRSAAARAPARRPAAT